jgi:hypothetical protein
VLSAPESISVPGRMPASFGRAWIAPVLDGAAGRKEIGNVGEVECGSRSPPHRGARTEGDEGARPMTLPNGLRRSSIKDWTPADDERLRELSLKGMDARAIGIELKRTATAVRSRAFRMNLMERRPVVSQIGAWEKRKLSLKARGADTL